MGTDAEWFRCYAVERVRAIFERCLTHASVSVPTVEADTNASELRAMAAAFELHAAELERHRNEREEHR